MKILSYNFLESSSSNAVRYLHKSYGGFGMDIAWSNIVSKASGEVCYRGILKGSKFAMFIKDYIFFKQKLQSGTSFSGQDIVFGTVDIFVISQPKWLKYDIQAHF